MGVDTGGCVVCGRTGGWMIGWMGVWRGHSGLGRETDICSGCLFFQPSSKTSKLPIQPTNLSLQEEVKLAKQIMGRLGNSVPPWLCVQMRNK